MNKGYYSVVVVLFGAGLLAGCFRPETNIDGVWLGKCYPIASGGYQQENITVIDGVFTQTYLNSEQVDCSAPWSQITKSYQYTLSNEASIARAGAFIELKLVDITLQPKDSLAVDALNSACTKKDFQLNKENQVLDVQCKGNVQYPALGVVHYDLIKKDNNITLGDTLDVVDPVQRATALSERRVFTLSSS